MVREAVPVAAKKRTGVRKFLWQLGKNKLLLLMLVPALVYIIMCSYVPMTGIVLAFKSYNYAQGIWGSPWCGMDNFQFLIISNKLWPLTRNTLLYNFAFIVVNNILEVAFAIIINELSGKIFKKTFQSLMFLPYFISWVVVAAIVQAVFGYEYGFINNLLEAVGLGRVNLYAIENTGYWPFLLVFFKAWKDIGYGSVVYLASVTGIDTDIYEAAEIDGANIWKRIRYITIPCLLPTMIIMLLLAVGQIFRGDFGLFYQLIGNNGQLLEVGDVLDLFIYRSMSRNNDIGMSSAAGLYQSILCFITIVCVNGLIRKADPEYSLF